MKVLFTLWISVVLIQEVVPSTLVRLPRDTKSSSSVVHTEYEAKYQQKGTNGNESSSTLSGNQKFVHDNCSENWNAFAEKCASLIKELVASLANVVSSKPGDATNLQLHIKNTFRHFDNTNNCTCLSHAGKSLSEIDLSPLFNNITIKTVSPTASGKSNGLGGNEHSDMHPSSSGSDPTTNSRREVKYPQVSYASHPSEHKTGTPVIDCHTTQPAVFPVTRIRHPKPTKTVSTDPVNKSHNMTPFIVIPTQTVSDSRNTKRAKVADTLLLTSVKHYLPSAVVAVNNSHSNIPETSTGKGDDVNTIHLSPVYDHKSSTPSSSIKLIIGESEKPCEKDCDSQSGNKNVSESSGASHVTPVLAYTEKSRVITSGDTTQSHRDGSDKTTANIFLTTPIPFYHVNTKPKAPKIENQKSDEKPIILVSGKTTEDCDGETRSVTPVLSKLTSVAPLVAVEKSTDSEEETGHREHRTHSHISRIGHLGHLGHLGHKGNKGHTIIAVTPSIVTPLHSKTTVSPTTGKTEDKEDSKDDKRVTPGIIIPAEITLEKKPTTKDCEDEKGVTPSTVIPAEITTEKKPATKDDDCDGKGKASHSSVVIPAEITLEKKPATKNEDCADGKGKSSDKTVLFPAEITLEKKSTTKGKDCDDEKAVTPAMIIPAGSLVLHKPDESKGKSSNTSVVVPAEITVEKIPATKDKENCDDEKRTTPAVVFPEEIIIEKKPATKDRDCDDEKGKSSDKTLVFPAEVTLEKKPATKDEDCDNGKGKSSDKTVLLPAEVIFEKKPATKDKDCDEEKGKSGHQTVVIPADLTLEKKPSIKDEDCDNDKGKSSHSSVVIPAEITLEKKPVTKNQDCDDGKGKSSEKTVVVPAELTVEKKSTTKDKDCNDEKDVTPAIVIPAGVTLEKKPATKDKDCDNEKGKSGHQTVVIPADLTLENKPSSKDEDCDNDKGKSSQSSVAVPTEIKVEKIPAIKDKEHCDDEKGVTPSVVIPAKLTVEKKPTSDNKDFDDNKGHSTGNTTVVVPVHTKPVEVTLKPAEKETNYDEEKGRAVTPSIVEIIKPVTVVTTGGSHRVKPAADDLVIPTTFQTTSVKPTLPPPIYLLSTNTKKPTTHSSISADSDEALVEKPKRPSHHDEDDEDDDCCSCESCTEEEISDPKHFKDTACRNLEEARRELKKIFDKITKKLKCGRKAPQTITAT